MKRLDLRYIVEGPDEDGDYRVALVSEGVEIDVQYNNDLSQIWPSAKEVLTELEAHSDHHP